MTIISPKVQTSSPELENQVGKRKDQLVCRQMVSRRSVGSPKVTELEDAEG